MTPTVNAIPLMTSLLTRCQLTAIRRHVTGVVVVDAVLPDPTGVPFFVLFRCCSFVVSPD